MIDSSRRTVLASGAAAAAASAVPQVFAQAQPAGAVPRLPASANVGFCEKGSVESATPRRRDRLRLSTAGDTWRRVELSYRRACRDHSGGFKNDGRPVRLALVDEKSGETVRLKDVRPQAGPGAHDLVRWRLEKFENRTRGQ
jgi:hypothetical protein